MRTKTQWKDLTRGQRIVSYSVAVILVLFGIWLTVMIIKTGEYPRLLKREYHWTRMMEDSWIYSPTDVDLWQDPKTGEYSAGINFGDNEPLGGIAKTSEGAWKAMWRGKTCGSGDYLNRELAEKCVESAAEGAGFFGYVFRQRNHEKDWKDVAGK